MITTLLADELEKAFATDPWYGPATATLLGDLSAEIAAARPDGRTHSIWDIVLHMTAWLDEVANRLDGRAPAEPVGGDWPAMPEPTPDAWHATRRALELAVMHLAAKIRRLDPDRLYDRVGTSRDRAVGSGVTCQEMLLGILQHNAYHSGQIAVLRRVLSARP